MSASEWSRDQKTNFFNLLLSEFYETEMPWMEQTKSMTQMTPEEMQAHYFKLTRKKNG
jgi:hypothetical protein